MLEVNSLMDLLVYYVEIQLDNYLKQGNKIVACVSVYTPDVVIHALGIIPFGASDAAALSREGVHAATIVAQNQLGTDYYHTRNDKPDNMCEKTVALGIDVSLAEVEIFDQKGITRDKE